MTDISPVRIGTLADEPAMLDLLQCMYQENCFVAKDDVRIQDALRRGLKRDGAIIGVIGSHDVIEASIGLFVAQYWYSSDRHMEDYWNFVHPEFRQQSRGGAKNPSYARELLKFAKRCSTELDIPLLIGVLSSHRTQAKVKLYERQFGPPAGAAFVFNAKHGSFAQAVSHG